jgi:Tfp pilus assembly protein FimT
MNTSSKSIFQTPESGRSMVEMLGVLAIIGVLSVGAIAGYSKAMNKYKMNKTVDQISNIVANLRTAFATTGNYSSLASNPIETAIKLGVFPEDMIVDSSHVKNLYNGDVNLTTVSVNSVAHGGFKLTYSGLPKEVTVFLGTAYWGDDNSGLLGMQIANSTATTE